MFICKKCKSVDKFDLLFAPDYHGEKQVSLYYNSKSEIEINIDGYVFNPDLQFMSNHATCNYCGQICNWGYNMRKNPEIEIKEEKENII